MCFDGRRAGGVCVDVIVVEKGGAGF